jgi:hypothetical protein
LCIEWAELPRETGARRGLRCVPQAVHRFQQGLGLAHETATQVHGTHRVEQARRQQRLIREFGGDTRRALIEYLAHRDLATL